jgi:hypothetical protein
MTVEPIMLARCLLYSGLLTSSTWSSMPRTSLRLWRTRSWKRFQCFLPAATRSDHFLTSGSTSEAAWLGADAPVVGAVG